jgi:hypothetical protein
MGTESEGFPDEPTFSLAALAGQEQLQERIRTLENERDGKVLVSWRDAWVAVGALQMYAPEGSPLAALADRLAEAAGEAPPS